MKKMVKRNINASSKGVIFEDEFFSLEEISGIGINNTPWTGLAVISKSLAKKHVVEIRLKTKGRQNFVGDPIYYTYVGCEVAHGTRPVADTLDDTAEYIKVLEDALDFAYRVNDYILYDYN